VILTRPSFLQNLFVYFHHIFFFLYPYILLFLLSLSQVAAGIPQANTFFGLNEKGNGNEHGRRSSVKASSLKYGSDESARVQGGGGGRGANVTADNSASVYNGRGWIGRQDGLSQDDVAARRHKVWKSCVFTSILRNLRPQPSSSSSFLFLLFFPLFESGKPQCYSCCRFDSCRGHGEWYPHSGCS